MSQSTFRFRNVMDGSELALLILDKSGCDPPVGDLWTLMSIDAAFRWSESKNSDFTCPAEVKTGRRRGSYHAEMVSLADAQECKNIF
jgi:hypothetical protein